MTATIKPATIGCAGLQARIPLIAIKLSEIPEPPGVRCRCYPHSKITTAMEVKRC